MCFSVLTSCEACPERHTLKWRVLGSLYKRGHLSNSLPQGIHIHFVELFGNNLDILSTNNIILFSFFFFFFSQMWLHETDLFLQPVPGSYKGHVSSLILKNPDIVEVLEKTSKPLINIPEC